MTSYLIRHAHAGSRSEWDRPDTARPLSEKGRRQADHLVSMLGDRPITRVVSSPAQRCRETVAPLASHLGVQTESDPVLLEGHEPDGVLALLDGHAGDGLVLCSHGDLIPEVIRLLRLRGMQIIGGEGGNKKGSVWVLEHDGERYHKAEYLPPG